MWRELPVFSDYVTDWRWSEANFPAGIIFTDWHVKVNKQRKCTKEACLSSYTIRSTRNASDYSLIQMFHPHTAAWWGKWGCSSWLCPSLLCFCWLCSAVLHALEEKIWKKGACSVCKDSQCDLAYWRVLSHVDSPLQTFPPICGEQRSQTNREKTSQWGPLNYWIGLTLLCFQTLYQVANTMFSTCCKLQLPSPLIVGHTGKGSWELQSTTLATPALHE